MPHIHELIDFVVGIYIVYREKILLVHHRQLDLWLPIGGHIELDEDPDQALAREIQEECGLEVEVLSDRPGFASANAKPLYRPMYVDIHRINDQHRHIGLIYVGIAKNNKVILNKDEHYDIRWFSSEDLNSLDKLSSRTKYYASTALDQAKSFLVK